MTEVSEIDKIIEKCIGDNLPYCQASLPPAYRCKGLCCPNQGREI